MLGSSPILWFDAFPELRGVSGGTTPSSTDVAVGLGSGETRATFVWDPDLTAPDDGLNVIVPTATPRTGCWKRLHNFEFNVMLYGAKGDGASDDSIPIRTALQALPTGGGEIYFPPGTYLLTQDGDNAWCLNLPDKVMLRGSGRGATILQLADNQGPFARPLSATSQSGITIRELTIDGNRLGQSGDIEQQHGLFLDACSETVIQDVAFQDTGGDSVFLHGYPILCTETVISGCLFSGGARVHVHAQSFTNLTITGCHFSNSLANNHIKQELDDPEPPGSSGASVTGCTFDGDSNSTGVLFAGHDGDTITTDIAVSGNVFRNLSFGVVMGRATQGWSIVGNTIDNCTQGIQNVSYSEQQGFDANRHMHISGNLIRNLSDQNTSPIFLSNCTVGSINGNTVYAPNSYLGIKTAQCSRVSVSNNTISIGTWGGDGFAQGLVIYRCNNCSVTGNLIDLPSPPDDTKIPVGVVVADDTTFISTNIAVQNNLVLGPANPAIAVTVNPSANVAVTGNLSPSAVAHLSAPVSPDVTDFTAGVLATQRIKMTPPFIPAPLTPAVTDNWNPPGIHGNSYVVLQTSPSAGATLTGIDAGYDGDYLFMVNYGPGSITFTHTDSRSSAANQLYLSGGTPQTIPVYGHISFRYNRYNPPNGWFQIG
jgi:hypothetical protein